MQQSSHDIYRPYDAEITERTQESPSIFTLTVKLTDPKIHQQYHFEPGQFNMMYLFGVGEVPISIVSDPEDSHTISHTIRTVGRVTDGLALLQPGDHVGIRGPFGRGWPLKEARNKDVLIITGGLGCAPSVSLINHIMKHRSNFGRLIILQGVKHSDDLIFREHYRAWEKQPNTQVLLVADLSKPSWPGHTGHVTDLLDLVELEVNNTLCMMCGPEGMMIAAIEKLLQSSFPSDAIHLSLERNMECAIGHCGHCQFGGTFICKNGPVFCYPEIAPLLGKKGF